MDVDYARIRVDWKKFNEIFSILTGHSFERHDRKYNSCVHSLMLYASKTLLMTRKVLTRLHYNDNVRGWTCSKQMSNRILT